MIDKKGIISNRTSFNEKQEVQARRIGVLNKNTDIRNSIMQRNIGKYAMWKEDLVPAIGEVYDVYGSENNIRYHLDENGLLGYTTTGTLGEYLNQHYKRDARDLEIYDIFNPTPSSLSKWGGKYENYIKYVSDVYGKEVNFYTQINDILGAYDIKYILENNRVGILRNPDPIASIGGVVLTNINNFSTHDTTLGEITNQLYAQTLLNAAYFNSLRRNEGITGGLKWEYGMSTNTVNRMDTLMGEFDEYGRIPYLPGQYENNLFEAPYYGHTPNTELNITEGINNEIEILWNGANDLSNFNKNQVQKYIDINRNRVYFNDEYGFEKIGYWQLLPYSPDISQTTKQVNPNLETNDYADYFKSYGEGDNAIEGMMVQVYDKTIKNGKIVAYDEAEQNGIRYDSNGKFYTDELSRLDTNDLLAKTSKLFRRRKIGTLVGRFHSTSDTSPDHTTPTQLQSAVSKYGISHGRNLLKVTPSKVNGYENPYCRVWTYHHQYDKIGKLIRPFSNEDGYGNYNTIGIGDLQGNWSTYSRHESGVSRLVNHTVLNPNGFVNITPTKGETGVDIKKTMFSIENLAWKDVNKNIDDKDIDKNLSKDQIGPLGGRIMWFPPYNIKFTENVSVDWNPNQFIGRAEKVYTYTDTERSGTLSFSILIDHPSVLNYWKEGKGNNEENEQSLLRFFAGCDTLDLELKKGEVKEKENISNEPVEPPMTPNEITPDDGKIIFYVFFPNNYSGIDDYPTKSDSENMVEGMSYLFCGEGVQEKQPLIYPNVQNLSGIGYEMSERGISNGEKIDGRWQYRVDNNWKSQSLRVSKNYIDNVSFQLNSKYVGIKEDATHTFAEIYATFNDDDDTVSFAVNNGADGYEINKLRKLFRDKDFTITRVDISGSASSHGYEDINENKLSINRATSIRNWLNKQKSFSNKINSDTKWTKDNVVGSVTSNDVNSLEAKVARSARVEVNYRINTITDLHDNNTYTTSEAESDVTPPANTFVIKDDFLLSQKESYYDLEYGITPYQFDASQIFQIEDKEETKKMSLNASKQSNPIGNIRNENNDTIPEIVHDKKAIDLPNEYKRYDNESEFFEELDINSPILRSRIIEKIQYFDPAFHSITPEGFNARLNFLHQCTRQGHTISVADGEGYARTAGNLAFGRPPVCVLRIGDFYNTRIIIQSMTIDYDTQQWDLNPEGIGVQPMIANVNLNFVFIGGSDLGGPIERLQNAISFNYYANTNVYDNRADSVTYNELGEPVYKQWLPKTDKNK